MKAIIIHNPAAGQRLYADELRATSEHLAEYGCEVLAIEETHGPGDATTFARRAARQGCDVVFVAGGDGTLAQAVDGLVHTETALAVLPGGTGNVFARQLNLPVPGGLHPWPILESARLMMEGQVRPVDVGRIMPRGSRGPGRHFLCWGGVGFDAEVNRAVDANPERKKRLGPGAFVVTSFLTLRHFAGTSAMVRIDGQRVSRRMIMLVANNIQLYGILFRMAQNAVLDDGWLDVYIFQGRGPARTLLHSLRLLFSRHLTDPEVDMRRAQRIEINTAQPLPVHVDSEYVGLTPVTIEVVPCSLKLLVPPCAPDSLFVGGTGMTLRQTPWDWMTRIARDTQSVLREWSPLS
jgi:YegS/Rv2252/BmrU family lipid kinase